MMSSKEKFQIACHANEATADMRVVGKTIATRRELTVPQQRTRRSGVMICTLASTITRSEMVISVKTSMETSLLETSTSALV
ncbi:hypothetical protein [Burkholderia singularis]|uniref:hypothetical protein n=1 Tax=Burkholderia singularis TaxID=1503053 RepID=UPI000F76B1E0|nr:hypothetical protein [Burkholderia singularis]